MQENPEAPNLNVAINEVLTTRLTPDKIHEIESSIIAALKPCLEDLPKSHNLIENEINAAKRLVDICEAGQLPELVSLMQRRSYDDSCRIPPALQKTLQGDGDSPQPLDDCQPPKDYRGEVDKVKGGKRWLNRLALAGTIMSIPAPLAVAATLERGERNGAMVAKAEVDNLPPGHPDKQKLQDKVEAANSNAELYEYLTDGTAGIAMLGVVMRGIASILAGGAAKRNREKKVAALGSVEKFLTNAY